MESLGDPGTSEPKPTSMLLGNLALCESRPAIHACQTNRPPHDRHIQRAREAETVERDCTSEPHPVRQHGKRCVDDSFRPHWDHRARSLP